MEPLHVAVIMGGRSTEREVSLATGANISRALESKGHKVQQFDLSSDLAAALLKNEPDVAYIALHGKFGEDGTVQGLLDILGIPYVGSGVLASALGMNKYMSKQIFRQNGIPVARDVLIRRQDLREPVDHQIHQLKATIGLPAVVKPNSQGSTVGVTIVRNETDFAGAIATAFSVDEEALVEQYIPGIEVTVAVIGNLHPRALPVIEIISTSKSAFYDYESKYTKGLSQHIIPARLPSQVLVQIQEISVRAYKAIGCRGFARVDLRVHEDTGDPFVLEINTLPGMTETSLVPDAARAEGIEFPELVELLIGLALGQERE